MPVMRAVGISRYWVAPLMSFSTAQSGVTATQGAGSPAWALGTQRPATIFHSASGSAARATAAARLAAAARTATGKVMAARLAAGAGMAATFAPRRMEGKARIASDPGCLEPWPRSCSSRSSLPAGRIAEPRQAGAILAAGQADRIALARTVLRGQNPHGKATSPGRKAGSPLPLTMDGPLRGR